MAPEQPERPRWRSGVAWTRPPGLARVADFPRNHGQATLATWHPNSRNVLRGVPGWHGQDRRVLPVLLISPLTTGKLRLPHGTRTAGTSSVAFRGGMDKTAGSCPCC